MWVSVFDVPVAFCCFQKISEREIQDILVQFLCDGTDSSCQYSCSFFGAAPYPEQMGGNGLILRCLFVEPFEGRQV